jgi:two-component system, response regulator PdtaR
LKVLIVDDEPLVRLSLKRALEKCGHEVADAADGQAGFEVWRKFSPDLTYLDVLMPRINGPDLLKALRSAGAVTGKVILMSAFTGDYNLERAKSVGADLFITKPFEDIFAIVKQGEELVRGKGK